MRGCKQAVTGGVRKKKIFRPATAVKRDSNTSVFL